MSETYDVVIIGGGPGGYNCAIRCGQLGLKTAIIEMRDTLGGTCLNVGCIPSKALLHASEFYAAAKNDFEGMGIEVSGLAVNLEKMMAQKDEAVKGLTEGVAFLMKKNKVKHYAGKGKIVGKGEVEIELNAGGTEKVGAKNIVIATGSEPASLPGIEIDEERIVTNTGALSLKEIPKKLTLIGAGVIGLEMGSVWSRLGAEVTVIEFLDHIMPGADAEISKQSKRIFEKQGLKFRMGTKVTGIEKLKTKLKVSVEPAKGGDEEQLDADVVIMAIGRKPYTEGLGLETIGVGVNQRGVIDTTDHFKTNVEGVWAIGDCVAGPMLAHKAEDDGAAVAELIAGKAGHVDYDLVPSVVYTSPEIAWVGKNEQQLKDAGIKYKTGKFPFMANSRARCNHETEGFVKILADATTDEILGVHMLGVGVGELIGEICVAMEFKASSEDVARTCHAHPTLSEAIRQAAMGVEGWTMQM
ncbi:dihydrolipoyl dehydrogenase [Ponticaulis sp.]|jgi:dihydrolipoamide dehydrogenase|uniref:dihydrolipoyl dehydrogenase n=1 Tax=Ponticaulis sp. TaxID=2020902 RepID=UPI000B6F413A|nr:dihydrolipoyl dehydrogenase [Ponticaulis sp.]MAJ07894.1 dihydrolipoyl dehydrogenase [Ponticaulis sp.]RPG18207.1 MAG: dihydrolipoyl dehydrogenase [Hyphomonadaceae bacterium TMED125]HBH90591.1 dihydrolipoyl dehydrogenase [Hyphomonadaceae bacterium]HBJ94707.1 dihydrolipoyl dehydrogenase [Hyphomonadaceae bacterium]|tara:strand:+ start:17131 stop:18537 length:1407 start_codon:yes stop_codon:yes gene_type:complete